jgi:hypothetical protein
LRWFREMQAWKFMPEVYLLHPDSDPGGRGGEALSRGIRPVCRLRRDGTVFGRFRRPPPGSPSQWELSRPAPGTTSPAAWAIPPRKSRRRRPSARGRRVRIDLGLSTLAAFMTSFLSSALPGLSSALFPAADGIQHGHLEKIGDFMTTLAASSASEIQLELDDGHSSAGAATRSWSSTCVLRAEILPVGKRGPFRTACSTCCFSGPVQAGLLAARPAGGPRAWRTPVSALLHAQDQDRRPGPPCRSWPTGASWAMGRPKSRSGAAPLA